MKKRKKLIHWFSKKSLISVVLMTALSIYYVFVAFYSYFPLSSNQLKSIDATISSVELCKIEGSRGSGRIWISLSLDCGIQYYFRTDNGGFTYNEAKEVVSYLEELRNKNITVYYTNRKPLRLYDIFVFGGLNRGVAIEYNNETVLSLESYNKASTDSLLTCLALSTILLAMIVADILISRPRKKHKKDRG